MKRTKKKDLNTYETRPREDAFNRNKTDRLKEEDGNFEYHKTKE